ncbi:unnamed protein product [marine sediment metagenome]|uniref:Uncharacterized protein n=1 Tax=marine sediment metagenome TaxID=412755 RepID=X0YEB6_9ZZZZ
MEEIKIYETPLSDGEHKEHSIAGLIREAPIRYHLIDVVKNLKHGRSAEDQKMIDEWIAMMELSERGAPFSSAIVNMAFDEAVPYSPEIKEIEVDTQAVDVLLYNGDFDIMDWDDENDPKNYVKFDDIFEKWVFEDDEWETIKPLEWFKGWSLYVNDNINDDRTDHDGSMYEDELIFVSPNGDRYSYVETHCMMTGWNFDGDKVTLVYKDTIPPKNEKIDKKDNDEDIRI